MKKFCTTHLISHPKYTYVLKIIFKTSVLKTKNQKLLGDMMFSIFFCFSSYSTSPLTLHFVLYLAPASTSCLKNLIQLHFENLKQCSKIDIKPTHNLIYAIYPTKHEEDLMHQNLEPWLYPKLMFINMQNIPCKVVMGIYFYCNV